MVATLAASKFAYGLYGPILVTAGMAMTPFRPFLVASLAMSAVILGAWFGFGFGLERAYGAMGHTGLVTGIEAGIGVGGLVALFFIGKHARKRLKIEGKKKGKGAPAETKMKGQ
jgi:hypothetical protein